MATNDERPALTGNSSRSGVNVLGVLATVLTFALGAVLAVAAFMFSLLVFAVLVIGGLLVWGYVWWKTRELRRRMRERPPGGHIIEGETIREVTPDDKDRT